MTMKLALSSMLGLLSIVAIQAAQAQSQPSRQSDAAPAPSRLGTAPSPGTSTAPGGGTTPTDSGRPSWLAAAAAASFPGDVLLNDQAPFLVGVNVDHPTLAYREGDTLTIKFKAEREAYLYLLYHQADGSSCLLFPNEALIDNHVPAGTWVTVPAGDQAYRFRVSAPFGAEVLQVIAALKPVAALDGLVQKQGRAASVTREQLGALHDTLRKDRRAWTEHRVTITTSARTAEVSARKAARVGLFIGVNKFQTTAADGEGKNASMRIGTELLAKAMIDQGKLDPGRTKLLIGEDATRANVEAAITRWLPSVTQPGDIVFIFYGGHGIVIHNLDGTKPDGRDGVLTTYNDDFRSRKLTTAQWEEEVRKHYITDAALARWLEELSGRQIALMVCSCFSGSMVDGKVLTRFGAQEATRVKGVSGLNVSVVTSCMPDETTLYSPGKPLWMAHDFSQAMNRLPHPVTLRQAYEYYKTEDHVRLRNYAEVGHAEPVMTDTALLPIVLAP
jgi:hypothetical protein